MPEGVFIVTLFCGRCKPKFLTLPPLIGTIKGRKIQMSLIYWFVSSNKCLTIAFLLSVSMTFFTIFAYASEQKRGISPITIKNSDGQEIDLYKESHALIIGISNYSMGWPTLRGVKKDIAELSAVLKNQRFHVVVVEDATHNQLIDSFSDFINLYGINPDSRILFYFSGHDFTVKQSYGGEMGYILPADTPDPDKDFRGFLQKAIDMQQIEVFAKRIQSRHALFIFDSCFSGSIFSVSRAMPRNITYKIAKPVRQFITPGSADEKVPDESIFLDLLIVGISGEGDLNSDGYVTGTELGSFLQDNVINYTHGYQHPQFGKIRSLYLSKGDFVFLLDDKSRDTVHSERVSGHIEVWKKKLKKSSRKYKKTVIPLPSF